MSFYVFIYLSNCPTKIVNKITITTRTHTRLNIKIIIKRYAKERVENKHVTVNRCFSSQTKVVCRKVEIEGLQQILLVGVYARERKNNASVMQMLVSKYSFK